VSEPGRGPVTLDAVMANREVQVYIDRGNAHLAAVGFTDHGARHAKLVSHIARNILDRLGCPERRAELAAIAGYLHDIGNVISRQDHGQTGAVIAWNILRGMGMEPRELAEVAAAVGNHEEGYGQPVNDISAALILADKSDVHRSRVRNPDPAKFDVHDRVNFASQRSFVRVDDQMREIVLELTVDTSISSVMEYFEIFLTRMLMCRRAAEFLGNRFRLEINGTRML